MYGSERQMIKIEFANGNQTITKVCNHCGCHIDNLQVEDIMQRAILCTRQIMLKLNCKDCDNTEVWSIIEFEYVSSHVVPCSQCDNDDMDITIKEIK